jgi:hypothetical protein
MQPAGTKQPNWPPAETTSKTLENWMHTSLLKIQIEKENQPLEDSLISL